MAESFPAPLPDTVKARIAGRLAMDFFLSALRICGDGHELLDGLILLAIRQSNLEHLERRPWLEESFLAAAPEPPAELLRPVSISALSNSLHIPFETVRRRLSKFRKAGLCEVRTVGGVVASWRQLTSERARYEAFALRRLLVTLLLGVRDFELVLDLPPLEAISRAPGLTISRVVTQYCLRQLEALTQHVSHPAHGLLLIHVIRASTEHLDDTFSEITQLEDLVDDRLRRPVSVAAIATRVGVPAETARRHAALLEKQGLIARRDGGLYLTREMLRGEPWPSARHSNLVNLRQMFLGLKGWAAASC